MNIIHLNNFYPMKFKHLLIFAAIILIATTGSLEQSVMAQGPNMWSPPQKIPGYDFDASTPYLVVDKNRTVHAFNSSKSGDEKVVVYSRWTLDNGWTIPVDILLSPQYGIANIQGAFLDDQGIMHLIFFGGNELDASIFYSNSPAMEADRARSWKPSRPVGSYAGPLSEAAFTGDGNGNLFIVYSGNGSGSGLYAVQSTDRGITWSEPYTVYLTGTDSLWPSHISLIVDSQGNLHVVWSDANPMGNGEAIYYARLEAGHEHWGTPVRLAVMEKYEADWPSIVEFNNELMIIYQNDQPATRWMIRSKDGGQTWSEPIRPFSRYRGEYGFAVLLADSNNSLHMILGNRTNNPAADAPDTHGMWHSVWDGNRWSTLESIVSGPKVVSEIGGNGFDPSGPQAVISQGNIFLVTWRQDGSSGFNGVWYSYARLDTPELSIAPLPITVSTTNPTLNSTQHSSELSITPTPKLLLSGNTESSYSGSPIENPTLLISLGLIPVILLTAIIVLRQRLNIHSH